MFTDFLLNIFQSRSEQEAVIWKNKSHSYQWLLNRIESWNSLLDQKKIGAGSVVVIQSDFSPAGIALLLALIEKSAIVIPLSPSSINKKEEYYSIARVQYEFVLIDDKHFDLKAFSPEKHHDLVEGLRQAKKPGLILFSSGSTGKSKATLHDFSKLLKKYTRPRHDLRTLVFLLFDHIGGIDTLLYSLSNGSCLIFIEDRSPENVCKTIQDHRVEVLPVSPTFINLLLISGSYKYCDLSSLKYVTYGAEVMPETTLKRCNDIFPDTKILQKYGTTEVGTLRSKSLDNGSLWFKIGGEGFDTRIIDGILQIKADSAMLGYLNADSPFTEDGWFITGDKVEQNGEYIRILGRESEIINVGGEKVYPAEVETVILEVEGVKDVTVYGEAHPLVGQMVCARVMPVPTADFKALKKRIKSHCHSQLQPFKVPAKIILSDNLNTTDRFKKMRRKLSGENQDRSE